MAKFKFFLMVPQGIFIFFCCDYLIEKKLIYIFSYLNVYKMFKFHYEKKKKLYIYKFKIFNYFIAYQ